MMSRSKTSLFGLLVFLCNGLTITSTFGIDCPCNPAGTRPGSTSCNIVKGGCYCKFNVIGTNCDQCQDGFFNLQDSNAAGCDACGCFQPGSSSTNCDTITGACMCSPGFGGDKCDRCATDFFGFPNCQPCDCFISGTVGMNATCNEANGQCNCLSMRAGRQCNRCAPDHVASPLNSDPAEQCQPVPPTVTFFTATPDLCGFTTALTCEANTNGTSPTGTTLHITRLNDGMDLSGDPRFMEFRSSTPPNILHVEYSFPQRLSDNGDYMCVVNNTAGTSVESVTLTSAESPPFASVSPPMQHVTSHPASTDSASFTCTARRTSFIPIAFTLLFQGTPATSPNIQVALVSDSIDRVTRNITVNNVTHSASGLYTCVFTTTCGNSSADHQLFVDVRPAVLDFVSLDLDCGQPISLFCVSSTGSTDPASATINITRLSDGVDLASDPRFTISRTELPPDSLHLKYSYNHVLTDNGDYLCRVTTDVGSSELMASITSSPSPPIVTVTPVHQDVQLVAGTEVGATFSCQGEQFLFSNTQQFQLMLNGEPVFDTITIFNFNETRLENILHEQVSLQFLRLAAEANYTCVFRSVCGNASASHSLNVIPPIADTAIPDGLSVTKFFLSAFQIICLVEVPFDSAPVTRVNWIRADNMAEVSFDPASPVRQSFSMATPSQYNLSLIFDSFLPNQTGVYDCVSLNEGGTSSSSIDVEIQLPVPPNITEWVTSSADCTGTFTWTCVADVGTEPLSDVNITFIRARDMLDLANDPRALITPTTPIIPNTIRSEITITNAILTDEGEYICKATSRLGTATASQHVAVLPHPPTVVQVMPITHQLLAGQENSVTFTCLATFSGSIPIPTFSLLSPSDGSPLPLGGKWSVSTVSMAGWPAFTQVNVTILNLTLADTGSYVCFFQSDCGNASTAVNLTTDAPPPIATVVGGSPVEVLFGQNLTVVCRVETPFVAENGTRIEWRRETDSNGLPCPPGPHAQQRRRTTANPEVQEQYLDLLSFQDADAGNYSCNASNVGGESSTSVLIRAAFEPGRIESFATTPTQCRDLLTLTCMYYTGSELDSTVTIQRNDTTTNLTMLGFVVHETRNGRDVVVTATKMSAVLIDSGLYICSSVGSSSTEMSMNNVDIILPPPTLTVSPVTIGVQLNAENEISAVFSCTIALFGGNEPTVFLSSAQHGMISLTPPKYNVALMRSMADLTATITINNLRLLDAQHYLCGFNGECGRELAYAIVNILPPIPTTSLPRGMNVTAVFRSPITIECHVSTPRETSNVTNIGWRLASSSFMFDGMPFMGITSNRITSWNEDTQIQVLSFEEATDDNSGVYTCAAMNDGGESTSNVSVSVIRDPPVITQSRASTPQLVSGNVVLSCGGNRSSYASTRTGDITWDIVRQSDGLSLPTVAGPNARFSVYNDSSGTDVTVMITINNVTKADSGDYICTISSDQGSATAIIPLNITAPPPFIENIAPGPGPFTIQPGQHGTLTLECRGVSVLIDASQATLTWTAPNGSLASLYPNANISVQQLNESVLLSRLTLSDGQHSESGLFTCTISNECGADSQSVLVLFQGAILLDGVNPGPFEVEVKEGELNPTILSLQHAATVTGNLSICYIDIQLTCPGCILNTPSNEKIFPTKALQTGRASITYTPRRLQYNATNAFSNEDLMLIIGNLEYLNLADEIKPGTREVLWRFDDCDSGFTAAQTTTLIHPKHVNDNPPFFDVCRIVSVVPPTL